jgi:hypothetical protein
MLDMNKREITLFGFIFLISISAVAIKFCPLPWAIALLTTSILLAYGAVASTRNSMKVVMINAAAICFALAAFEGYLGIVELQGDGTRMEGSITEGFTHSDNVLGYAPNKNTQVTARKFYGDMLIYDVVYTIGPTGLRTSPPANQPTRGCVVFFGDSVTFGEGVNDQEAFPYQVGLKTKGEYQIFNLGFSGYGPHQMLASLQAHRLEESVKCRPTYFIYLAIPEHIMRVVGLTSWDRHGPRYRLKQDGTLVRDGNFDTPSSRIPLWVQKAIGSYHTWQKLFGNERQPDNADLELFLAVIRKAAHIIHQRYPKSQFDVILWDARNDQRIAVIENNLLAAKIPVYLLTSAIPDFLANWRHYVLSAHDLHPNATAHKLIADYVVSHILQPRIIDGVQKSNMN